jgi:hypothetical protein
MVGEAMGSKGPFCFGPSGNLQSRIFLLAGKAKDNCLVGGLRLIMPVVSQTTI